MALCTQSSLAAAAPPAGTLSRERESLYTVTERESPCRSPPKELQDAKLPTNYSSDLSVQCLGSSLVVFPISRPSVFSPFTSFFFFSSFLLLIFLIKKIKSEWECEWNKGDFYLLRLVRECVFAFGISSFDV